MKKFVIWLFNLNNLRALYVSERMTQRKRDEEEFRAKFRAEQDSHEREMDLLKQSQEAELTMINRELSDYKIREKELITREYQVRKGWKKNISDYSELYSRMNAIANFFVKETAEIHRVLDTSENDVKKRLR